MSVQSEINRINGAKTDIGAAIAEKGVTVPAGTKIDAMAPLIRSIEAGSGDESADILDMIAKNSGSFSYNNNAISYIGSYAFAYCYPIKNIDCQNCTSIGMYALYFASGLKNANFPACTQMSVSAFFSCTALTKADFPLLPSIPASAFVYCSRISVANFPACTYVDSAAFQSCHRLATLNFPVCETIGSYAFYRCSSIAIASFPALSVIWNSAFLSCSKLSAFVLAGSSVCALKASNAFSSTPIKSGTGYIYVPSSLVASYKAATNWTYFSNQISAIEDSPYA